MIIENFIENDDGSVDLILTLTSNEAMVLLKRGFVEMLEEYAAKEEDKHEVAALLRSRESKGKETK